MKELLENPPEWAIKHGHAAGQRKRRNKKPEEPVVKAHMQFLQLHGFYVCRYESKAKMISGTWRSSGLEYGTPDIMGVSPEGYYVACEVKAHGKRSTLRPGQKLFLEEIIKRKGFGICSDSIEYFQKTWVKWLELRLTFGVQFLFGELPVSSRKV